MMELLHEDHPGNNQMKSVARSFVWWPGIDKVIEQRIKPCEACQSIRHSPPPAPLHPWGYPDAPWEQLHADFAGPFLGKTFLIVIDAHLKWLEVRQVSAATSFITIEHF